MLWATLVIRWVGGEAVWESGVGVGLALAAMLAVALWSRRMTMKVYGALVLVGLLFRLLDSFLDTEGRLISVLGVMAMVVIAYLIGDRAAEHGPEQGGGEV